MKFERGETSHFKVRSRFHSRCTYGDSQALQDHARSSVKGTELVELLGFEYHGLITLGRSAELQSEIRSSEPLPHVLNPSSSLQVVHTDRGGKATLHSEGQLVVYPILDLNQYFMGVREYVEFLEQVTLSFLRRYGISGFARPGVPGVFTDQGKIAFIGLRVEEGVTKHGISLNICNDLRLFDQIRICGSDHLRLCSLQNLTPGTMALPSVEEAFHFWVESFRDHLYHQRKGSLGAVGSAFP